MNGKESEFLLEEYKTAWQNILNIDERRSKFLHYYSFLLVGVIGFVVKFVTAEANLKESYSLLRIAIAMLLFAAILAGICVIYMLSFERKSNIRYRKKVNLIRGLILGDSDDRNIKNYLSHKELGIKVLTDADQPKGIGKTLKWAIVILIIELTVLFLGLVYIIYPLFKSRYCVF